MRLINIESYLKNKREYGKKRYRFMSEEDKLKLKNDEKRHRKVKFNKTILKYKEFEFTKNKFQNFKHPIDRDKVVVDVKILCESMSFSNEKDYTHFIGYKTNNCIKLLCIILPQRNGCIKCFHSFHY